MAKKTAAGTARTRAATTRTGKAGAPKVRPATEAEFAAPGKRHQPTRAIGEGTPSADARPGATSQAGILVDDPDEDEARARQRARTKMTVQATQPGYYGDERRRPGQVFRIYGDEDNPLLDRQVDDPDNPGKKKLQRGVFSKRWMRRVPENTPLSGQKGPNQIIREQHDEILGARQRAKAGGQRPAEDIEDTGDNPLDAD